MQKEVIQWKLRRLASRARRVFEQHKGDAPSIAAYEQPLISAVTGFIASYDTLRVLDSKRATELGQGKAAVQNLHRLLRSWSSLIAMNRSISGFDPTSFGDTPEVMQDVLDDAKAFIELVTLHADKVANSELLLAEVGEALTLATTAWNESEDLRKEHQSLLEENRKNAETLHDTLVAFRRTLAQMVGRAHPSYRKLKLGSIQHTELEPGEENGLPPNLVPEPAEEASKG